MQISLRRFYYFVRVEWKTVRGESIIVFCSNYDLQIITCFSSFRIYLIYVQIFAILYTLPKYPKFLFYITYMYICHNQYLQCVTVISTSSFINIQIPDFSFPVTSSFVCFTMLQNIYREKTQSILPQNHLRTLSAFPILHGCCGSFTMCMQMIFIYINYILTPDSRQHIHFSPPPEST